MAVLIRIHRVDEVRLLARLVEELLRVVARLDQRVTYYGHGSDAAAMVTRVGQRAAYFVGQSGNADQPWVVEDRRMAKQVPLPDWGGGITEQEVLDRGLPLLPVDVINDEFASRPVSFYDQCREAADRGDYQAPIRSFLEVRQGHGLGWISDEQLAELRAIVRAAGRDGLGS